MAKQFLASFGGPLSLQVRIGLALLGALAATSVHGAAGYIQFMNGEGRVILAGGGERTAVKGLELNEGDTVVTARGATMQLRMSDDGLIAVRSDTRLRIDTYQYAGREDGSERGILDLVRGGFRTITGIIGRLNKQNLIVHAPNATVGIRGTDHEIVHIPAPAPGETALGVAGTYNKVNVGETYMETPAGRLDLGPNEVGFAGLVAGIGPVRLQSVPPFMRATPPQQGRDDRRQVRESAPNDQRRIAQRAQPGSGPGARQDQRAGARPDQGPGTPQDRGPGPGQDQGPGTRPAQGPGVPQNQGPGILQAQGQPIGMQLQPQGPPPLVPVNSVDNAVSFSNVGPMLARAPDRYSGVGGDLSQNGIMGSGAIITGDSSGAIFFGQDGLPALLAEPSGFSYARSGAPNIAPGSINLVDGAVSVPIQWGVYAGGAIVDSQGGRLARFFHFMGAQGTPLAVVNTLSGSYSTLIAQTRPFTESGALGGNVGAANITVAAGKLTGYSVSATDAAARSWAGSCSSCGGGVALVQFANSGVSLSGTGPGGAASGHANGAPIGPSGAGFISSFNLKTTAGLGVTGSFAVK